MLQILVGYLFQSSHLSIPPFISLPAPFFVFPSCGELYTFTLLQLQSLVLRFNHFWLWEWGLSFAALRVLNNISIESVAYNCISED